MVRIGFPGGPRLEWYDRNPIVRVQSYFSGPLAPHALTTRWTYTVPTGKKAFLESALTLVQRRTAATSAVWLESAITYQPSGGSEGYVLYSMIITNTVAEKDRAALGNLGVLLVGDVLRGKTSNLDTGGTSDHQVLAKIMEFDA